MSSQSDEDQGKSTEVPNSVVPIDSLDDSFQDPEFRSSPTVNSVPDSKSDTLVQAEQEDHVESRSDSPAPEAGSVDGEAKADVSHSEQAQTESPVKELEQSLQMSQATKDERHAQEQSPNMTAATEGQRSASDEGRASPAAAEEMMAIDLTDGASAFATTNSELDTTGVEPTEDATPAPPSSGTPMCTVETQSDGMQAQEVIDLTMSDDEDQEPVVVIQKSSAPVVKKEPQEHSNQDVIQSDFQRSDEDYATGTDVGAAGPHQSTDEGMDPAEMLQIAMFNFNKASSQEDRNGEAGASIQYQHDASDIHEFDSEGEDTRLTKNFQSLKRVYQHKKRNNKLTEEDEIDYSRACNAEEERKQLRSNRSAYQYRDAQDNSMFIPEEEPTPSPPVAELSDHSDDEFNATAPSKEQVLQEFLLGNREAQNKAGSKAGKAKGRGRPRKEVAGHEKVARDGVARPRTTRGRGGERGNKGAGRRKTGHTLTDLDSLFLANNIIEDATANLDKGDQPALGASRNKKKALQALIASIPVDQRDLYVGDKIDLEKATRAFTRGTMRSDTKGGFVLKGMNSSLHHYQVLDTRFCRERENSKTRPFGGILGHEMGLGKTVMMIANILDGRQLATNKPRATLIVVPPAITTQWLREIGLHVSRSVLQDVIVYRSGRDGTMSTDPLRTVANNDIVITSYHEVMRSWPLNAPPSYLVTEQAKREWWEKHLRTTRGVLHRVKWHRVVLDEAQAIKNYESKTSEAVCNLDSKYRWAISGTPVQNRLEEFYPYFRFLRCDHTGTFELFKKNFCKRGSVAATQRLQVYLSKIMIRRTHKDQIFGRPILKLPEIKPVDTIEVEFNVVERAVYQIVRNRFWQKLKVFRTKDGIEKNYRTVFVLLLRLRQLVGHPLLIQLTLKSLLETEDLERLWQITETEAEQQVDEDGRNTIIGLRAALNHAQTSESPTNGRRNSEITEASSSSQLQVAGPTTDSQGSASFHFRKYLQALKRAGNWEEINARSTCHLCKEYPTKPHITACMHIYCLGCLRELQYNAARSSGTSGPDDATCVACGSRFKKSEAYAARGFEEASDRNATPYSVRSNLQGRRRKSADDEDEDIDWFTLGGPMMESAKTKAAVKKMEQWWAADEKAKIIIFVQFRGMIKIFSRICKERGWGFAFFHGAMSFSARDAAIERFSTDDDCKVLISAMKAGGVGLNLVAANRVIIIDLWWNQSVETQAFCRVFRIGQKREVEVARFVVKDTIDMDILQMQERKTREVESAMAESNRPTRLTTAELMKLFGPVQVDDDGPAAGEGMDEDEGFIMVDDPYENLGEDDVVMTGA